MAADLEPFLMWNVFASTGGVGWRNRIGLHVHTVDEPHPPGELTNSIAGIRIRSYGDEPDGAFVEVFGYDPWVAVGALERTLALVPSLERCYLP